MRMSSYYQVCSIINKHMAGLNLPILFNVSTLHTTVEEYHLKIRVFLRQFQIRQDSLSLTVRVIRYTYYTNLKALLFVVYYLVSEAPLNTSRIKCSLRILENLRTIIICMIIIYRNSLYTIIRKNLSKPRRRFKPEVLNLVALISWSYSLI